MKSYRCKGKYCNNEITEKEMTFNRMCLPIYYGLCDSCISKLNNAIDKAVSKYRKELESRGKHSDSEIYKLCTVYKRKLRNE
jgi:hypothetical protein